MPRRGKGSKSQAVRTAKDQAYGEAAVQAEAQSVVPLPQTTAPGTAIQPTAQPLAEHSLVLSDHRNAPANQLGHQPQFKPLRN